MAEIDREKVKKGLECCSEHIEDASCSDCPYVDDCDIGECTSELAHDTLDLLEEKNEQIQELQRKLKIYMELASELD